MPCPTRKSSSPQTGARSMAIPPSSGSFPAMPISHSIASAGSWRPTGLRRARFEISATGPLQAGRPERLLPYLASMPGMPGISICRRPRSPDGQDTACGVFASPTASGEVEAIARWRAIESTKDREPNSALILSRQPFQRLFANAPVGIAVLDRFGRFVEANRAVGELFGASPQELIGSELIGLLNEGERAALSAKLAMASDGAVDREPDRGPPRKPARKGDRPTAQPADHQDVDSPSCAGIAADAVTPPASATAARGNSDGAA